MSKHTCTCAGGNLATGSYHFADCPAVACICSPRHSVECPAGALPPRPIGPVQDGLGRVISEIYEETVRPPRPMRVFTYPESMPHDDLVHAGDALREAERRGGFALVPDGIQEIGASATATAFESTFIAAEEATDAYETHQRECGPCRDRIDCDKLERLDAAAVTAGSAHAAAAEASRAAWAARRRP